MSASVSQNERGHTVPVIAIDGPGGSGKGTVSRIVAQRLSWHFLDSGALYRVVAVAAGQCQIAVEDEAAVMDIARNLRAEFRSVDNHEEILLDGRDVTAQVRSEETGNLASRIAVIPAVRQALLKRQRDFRRPPGLVADGRDMGTVVFPDANLKIFLTASAEERARRRYKQLKEKGISVNLSRLLDEIIERDNRDSLRSTAPMKPAPDAQVVDTTGIAVDDVVERVLVLCEAESD